MRKIVQSTLFCLSFIATGPALAEDCSNPQSQMQLNICANEAYKAADAELNAAYKKVRKHFEGWDAESPVNLSKSLLTAQRAWLKFRDAHCETVADQYAGGSIQPMVAASCLTDATNARTRQLLKFLQEG